jgi:probable addiction module antidote protein
MPKRTGDFDAWLLNELADPQLAANYVNTAIREDPDLLPVVLREVAKAHTMKKVAEYAGVARESLYTSLSEVGNPTLTNLNGILKAVGLKIEIVPDSEKASVQEPSPGLAIVDNPPKDNARSAIDMLTIGLNFNVNNPSTVIFLGPEPSLGVGDFSFEVQSGTGAETPRLLGLRAPGFPSTLQDPTQDRSGVFDAAEMALVPEQSYLKQLARPASIGTQQAIH